MGSSSEARLPVGTARGLRALGTARQAAGTLREYVLFDLGLYRKGAALLGLVAGMTLLTLRQGRAALKVLTAVHRAAYLSVADRTIEQVLRGAFKSATFARPLADACRAHVVHVGQDNPFRSNPAKLLGPLIMVLRSPTERHKGVIVLQYNHVFPIFAAHFDVEQIARRYHIVLEPSWSGFCTEDVLCYARFGLPVFVQAFEPRDRRLLESLDAGFVAVPTSTNWWVDHRIFRPLPDVSKDVDLIMVAGWGTYKRHAMFFRALQTLRRLRPGIRTVLVGYPLGLNRETILASARGYGVADGLECFENLTQPEVNVQLNRARINVLWSRKEGVNRAIVEGMFADIPCVIRHGFNYGHHYEYINEETGRFATERELAGTILDMLQSIDTFHPRRWVMQHMSCQRSTEILREVVDGGAGGAQPLAVKVNGLHGMHYWDEADKGRFEDDYRYLTERIRPATSGRHTSGF